MRRVTITEVARAAGVSKQTVSRVLNNKGELSPSTRERVLQVMGELGYLPNASARSLLTGKASALGLVVPDITNPFFIEIAKGVQSAARLRDYHVLLYDTAEDPELETQSVRLLHEGRADGIIICSSRLSDGRLASLLKGAGPVVLINRRVGELEVTQIGADYVAAACMATNHLIELGHRRIAVITLAAETANSQSKLRGYLEAMAKAGLPVEPQLIVRADSNVQGGYEATMQMLSLEEPPTAVVGYGDLVAIGALHACHTWGLSVPADLAIIGFGGSQITAFVNPPLSTVFIPNHDLGRQAVALLLEQVVDKDGPVRLIEVEARLIIRASTVASTLHASPPDLRVGAYRLSGI